METDRAAAAVRRERACPDCGRRTRHPDDIDAGYCPSCHWWTGDAQLREARREELRERVPGWHDYLTDCEWVFDRRPPFTERCPHTVRHLPAWWEILGLVGGYGAQQALACASGHLASLLPAERSLITAERLEAFQAAVRAWQDDDL